MTKPQIMIVNAKPISQAGGYQTYTRWLGSVIGSLGYKVRIISGPPLPQPLAFWPLVALILSLRAIPHLKTHRLIIGVGPWALAGAILKLFYPDLRLIAFYPTTIKHEFDGEIANLLSPDYPVSKKILPLAAKFTILPVYTWLESWLLSKADKIIVHYRSGIKILIDQFGISKRKIWLTPDNVPAPNRAIKFKSRSDKPVITCLSRHDGRKGINILVHALGLLNAQNCRFKAIIASTGPLLSCHRQLAARLGLDNVVEFPGFVKNTRALFGKTSVFVLPSLEEGSSSLALVEAMRAGLPVVATNVDGIPEDVKHNQSALFVPPGNPKALASAIRNILENPRFGRRLGHNAQRAYFQKHNSTNTRHAIKKFLTNLERN